MPPHLLPIALAQQPADGFAGWAGPFLLWPRSRPDALAVLMGGARRLAALERARRTAFFGDAFPAPYRAPDAKVLRFLALRCSAGLLCTVVLALLDFGAALAALLVAGAVRGPEAPSSTPKS